MVKINKTINVLPCTGIFKKSIAANALTLRQDESRNAEGNTMVNEDSLSLN